MKTYVNTRSISGRTTGVQRYGREIISRINNINVLGEKEGAGIRGHLWEQLILPKLVSDGVLWSPANTGPISVSRQVITIHDVAALDHPEWFSKKFSSWYSLLLPRVARKAEKIITVSEFSKSRIVEKCEVDPDKIHVTYLGVGEEFKRKKDKLLDDTILSNLGLVSEKYYLFVSSLEPRKNMIGILNAWKAWKDKPKDIYLAFIGDTTEIFSSVDLSYDQDNIVFTGRISDEELYIVYRNAYTFLYVSLYEGFGLPVLESMAAGIPVIASNTTSIPEAAGGAALLIDPLSINDISNAMKRLFEDKDFRDRLIILGNEHVKSFSWDLTAQKTLSVINIVSKS